MRVSLSYVVVGAGLVIFLMCVMRREEGRRVNVCMGEDSCSTQTVKECSEFKLVATFQSPFVPQTERQRQKVEKYNSLASGPVHAQLRKLNHVPGSPV